MKVVLIKDVKDIGRAHETVEAKDGYALNYLIPKKLAIAATASAMKEAEGRQKQAVQKHELDQKLVAQNIASLAEQRIVIRAKVSEKGHLYDSIGEPEILAAAREQAKVELPEGAIRLEKPLKELGTYTIPVSAGETFGKFDILVEAEE